MAAAVQLDAYDADARAALIAKHDLVISMLPAFMHMDVLKDCLRLKKHVITPSYVPDALWPLDAEFKKAGLIVLNEMGLDPGIDHMSAMRILDRIRGEGGRMEAFESYLRRTGGAGKRRQPLGLQVQLEPAQCGARRAGRCREVHPGRRDRSTSPTTSSSSGPCW